MTKGFTCGRYDAAAARQDIPLLAMYEWNYGDSVQAPSLDKLFDPPS
jgi:hypothetical protein